MSADEELVRRLHTGDASAAWELFARYWRAARAAAFAVTGEWAGAEDAASEGLSEALAGIQALQDPTRFGAWLRTIVIRKARAGPEASIAGAKPGIRSSNRSTPVAGQIAHPTPTGRRAPSSPAERRSSSTSPANASPSGACWPSGPDVQRASKRPSCASTWSRGPR